MMQTRKQSLLEAVTNVKVGYGLAVAMQLLAFPIFGLSVTVPQSLGIAVLFSGLSVIRAYVLRRLFNAWRS